MLDPGPLVLDEAARLAEAEREARAHGHTEGYEAGLSEAARHTEHALAALATLLTEIEQSHSTFLERAERSAVELGLALADKVVAAALELRPQLVLAAVEGAVRRTTARDKLVVLVNPDDLEQVTGAADALCARLGGIGRLDIVADRRVIPGSCTVRTTEGEIDTNPRDQIARAELVIRSALSGADDA